MYVHFLVFFGLLQKTCLIISLPSLWMAKNDVSGKNMPSNFGFEVLCHQRMHSYLVLQVWGKAFKSQWWESSPAEKGSVTGPGMVGNHSSFEITPLPGSRYRTWSYTLADFFPRYKGCACCNIAAPHHIVKSWDQLLLSKDNDLAFPLQLSY